MSVSRRRSVCQDCMHSCTPFIHVCTAPHQAMDRAHRLGQRRTVNVYRLIMRDTLEERIMGLQRFKIDVANAVVNQVGFDSRNAGGSCLGTRVLHQGEAVHGRRPRKMCRLPLPWAGVRLSQRVT